VRDHTEFKHRFLATKLIAPEWQPDKKYMEQVKNEVKDQEAKLQGLAAETHVEETDEQKLKSCTIFLQNFDAKKTHQLQEAEFEKDNDANFHIDFITSCANMRAWNYHIPIATRHKCKMIAGKIIPAVATTTAMITGVVEMELLKLGLGLNVDKFCNSNINLAVSDFKLFEPIGPKRAKEFYDPEENEIVLPVPDGWTVWDKILIDKGDLTVGEFVEAFTAIHHECTLVSLFFKQPIDGNPIWLDFPVTPAQNTLVTTNTPKKISDIYLERFKSFPEGRSYILLYGSTQAKEGRAASVPPIVFVYKSHHL